jgi:TniQ
MTNLEPYPDEIASGQLLRLTPKPQFEELLRRVAGARYPRQPYASQGWPSSVRLKALALASGLDVGQYIGRHTLLPLVSFFNEEWRNQAIREGSDAPVGWKTYFRRLARGQAFFCELCVSEDRSRFGTSYWHLSHQMPGTYECPIHANQPLSTAPLDLDASHRPPVGVAEDAQFHSMALIHHPLVRRYNATCIAMHALREPVSTPQMRTALCRRARSAGLRLNGGGGRLLLSDVAWHLLPAEFVQEEFGPEGRRAKTIGSVYPPIDAVLGSGIFSVASVALALTLLYDSVGEAFKNCFRTPTQQEQPVR